MGVKDLGGRRSLAFAFALTQASGDFVIPDPPGETATFVVGPASWDTRPLAARQGTYGPTRSGLYWIVDLFYVWWSQEDADGNQVGVDPGPFVAELDGLTGIEVPLGPGTLTASQVATATRNTLDAVFDIVGGTGAEVAITDDIDAGACTVGGLFDFSDAGQAMTRRSTPQFFASPLDGAIGQFAVWSGGNVIVTAIGVHLSNTDTPLRLAIYTGGTSASLADTQLLTQAYVDSGGALGWNWGACPGALLQNGNIRLVAHSNGASIPGYVINTDLADSDWPDAGGGSTYNLEVYADTGRDPSTPWGPTLSVETPTNANPVYAMLAFQWIAADGTSGVWRTRVGIHLADADVTDLAQQSSLIVPDAGGANLLMGVPDLGIAGAVLDQVGIVYGTSHTTQFRLFVSVGGIITDAGSAVVLWSGLTAGSATNAWVDVDVPGDVAVPAGLLWWGARNNVATASLRFALNINRETASPDNNPADWTDDSEFEIFSDSAAHSTNPAVAVESPIDTSTGTIARNTNYPGSRIRLRIPADTVSAS